MSYHADRGGKSSFEKNAFKVLSAFYSNSRAAKTKDSYLRALNSSGSHIITLDLWGIFAIDFHRTEPKTIENNTLFTKNRFFDNSGHM